MGLEEISDLFCLFLVDSREEDCPFAVELVWKSEREGMIPCGGAPRLWRIGDSKDFPS